MVGREWRPCLSSISLFSSNSKKNNGANRCWALATLGF